MFSFAEGQTRLFSILTHPFLPLVLSCLVVACLFIEFWRARLKLAVGQTKRVKMEPW